MELMPQAYSLEYMQTDEKKYYQYKESGIYFVSCSFEKTMEMLRHAMSKSNQKLMPKFK